MDNETMFSDDSLLISDGDENLLERPDGQYSLFTSGQGGTYESLNPDRFYFVNDASVKLMLLYGNSILAESNWPK